MVVSRSLNILAMSLDLGRSCLFLGLKFRKSSKLIIDQCSLSLRTRKGMGSGKRLAILIGLQVVIGVDCSSSQMVRWGCSAAARRAIFTLKIDMVYLKYKHMLSETLSMMPYEGTRSDSMTSTTQCTLSTMNQDTLTGKTESKQVNKTIYGYTTRHSATRHLLNKHESSHALPTLL